MITENIQSFIGGNISSGMLIFYKLFITSTVPLMNITLQLNENYPNSISLSPQRFGNLTTVAVKQAILGFGQGLGSNITNLIGKKNVKIPSREAHCLLS